MHVKFQLKLEPRIGWEMFKSKGSEETTLVVCFTFKTLESQAAILSMYFISGCACQTLGSSPSFAKAQVKLTDLAMRHKSAIGIYLYQAPSENSLGEVQV